MMLVSGCKVIFPSSAKLLGTRCASLKHSGNSAKIRAATEMSLLTISIPADFANALMTGKNAQVASAGASSVKVYMIFEFPDAMTIP
jgi:hypothetical protein